MIGEPSTFADPAADSGYRGEKLATLTGSVVNERAEPPTDARVVLVWINFASDGDRYAADYAEVTGSFPAQSSACSRRPGSSARGPSRTAAC